MASMAGALVVAMAAASMTESCASSPDPNRITQIIAPTYDSFKGVNLAAGQAGVSAFIEKRCGTLDCHGQAGRPLRIYGRTGLRFPDDADNVPGQAGTTETELLANYQSIIGLEPEVLSQVVADPTNNPPTRLLIVKKPRLLERHKGGAVVIAGDDGDTCLTSWLAGATDYGKCGASLQVP
jgi:hypothetical protein